LADEAFVGDALAAEVSARMALAKLLAGSGRPFLAGIHLRAALPIAEQQGAEDAAAQIRAMIQVIDATL
jgi:hypothetical protein